MEFIIYSIHSKPSNISGHSELSTKTETWDPGNGPLEETRGGPILWEWMHPARLAARVQWTGAPTIPVEKVLVKR